MVAELNFGFWRYLVASRYLTSLWIPAMHNAFPRGSSDLRRRRTDVDIRLNKLLLVRNRAAHHEPIHTRNLAGDMTAAREVVDWVRKDSAHWLTAKATLTNVISDKPAPS